MPLFLSAWPWLSHARSDKAVACDRLTEICESLAGTPYVWGGESRGGADCSGFVYLVCKMYGRPIPRVTARKLWVLFNGAAVSWQEAGCGYFVWWTFSAGRPFGHVGIMVEPPAFWQSGRSAGVYRRSFFEGSFWDTHFAGAKAGL